jgi:small conductance mechanosensitive channel
MSSVADLLDKLVLKLQSWLEQLVVMLPNLLLACLVVVLAVFVARWVQQLVYGLVHRVSGNEPISSLLATVARITVIVIALFFGLGLLQLEKTVTSLLAGVGVLGLALGFAFQDIAANFMSGFLMAIRGPFSVGDLIDVGGHRGVVKHIALRATEIETLDGLSVLIPNKDVFQNPIVNYTRTEPRRLDLEVGTAYCDDMEKVRRVVLEAVADLELRAPDRALEFYFDAFGDSSIDFTVRIWLSRSDEITYRSARSEAMIAVKKAFDAEGITIPFPIRTLDFGAAVVGGARIDAMDLHVIDGPRK